LDIIPLSLTTIDYNTGRVVEQDRGFLVAVQNTIRSNNCYNLQDTVIKLRRRKKKFFFYLLKEIYNE